MEAVSQVEVQNWIALYLATAICCAFAITCTTASLAVEMIAERFWSEPWTLRRLALFAPKTWWRWQRRYFLSTPMTLSIVGVFAATLSWS